jgi:hypothetical protein
MLWLFVCPPGDMAIVSFFFFFSFYVKKIDISTYKKKKNDISNNLVNVKNLEF